MLSFLFTMLTILSTVLMIILIDYDYYYSYIRLFCLEKRVIIDH